MNLPQKEDIIKRLTERFGYPAQGAELVADKIARLHPTLQTAFQEWWSAGEVPTVEVEGYSAAKLMSERGLNPIAALLTLDWLARDPEAAKDALVRGHDKVVSGAQASQQE